MYRSWAYILMAAATLAGMVALLWPSPQVRTIEEIAAPVRAAPRAEAPAKAPKPPAKASQAKPKPEAAPAPPAVIKKMPAQNTTTRRSAPVLQNGLQPNMFGRPIDEGVQTFPPPAPPAIGAARPPARPTPPGAAPAPERPPRTPPGR